MKAVLCRAIDEARKSAGFLLFAYVIMLDHLHLLTNRPTTTSDLLRALKGLTARRVIDQLKAQNHTSSLAKLQHQERERNYKYSLWQTEKNVLSIFSESMFMRKVNYIHQNPVRAGLVEKATDYRWSSARIWQGCPTPDEPLLVDKTSFSGELPEVRAKPAPGAKPDEKSRAYGGAEPPPHTRRQSRDEHCRLTIANYRFMSIPRITQHVPSESVAILRNGTVFDATELSCCASSTRRYRVTVLTQLPVY